MGRQELEDAKAHQTGGHGHDGHPSRLQAKVDIGSTDDGAHGQPDRHASDREAAPGGNRRSHGVGGIGDDVGAAALVCDDTRCAVQPPPGR